MSWTYLIPPDIQIDVIRVMIGDTDALKPIFSNEEIKLFYFVQQSTFQSSMFFSAPAGQTLPSSPSSYLRVAALALDSMASNSAYLAGVRSLPDITLDLASTSAALRAMAKEYREVDDNSGAFFIIEQVTTCWAFRDRFWAQVQRQSGG